MAMFFLLVFRFLRLLLSGHEAVAPENAAPRRQIPAFQQKRKRPLLSTLDRVFWITLRSLWDDWRKPLLYVQPDTVVRWQRERFRRFWARLSQPQRRGRGRPRTAAELRRLIAQMVAAHPLWRFLGLKTGAVPSEFVGRIQVLTAHLSTLHWPTLAFGATSLAVVLL